MCNDLYLIDTLLIDVRIVMNIEMYGLKEISFTILPLAKQNRSTARKTLKPYFS